MPGGGKGMQPARRAATMVGSTGALSGSWTPALDGPVESLALSGGRLYVGGRFSGRDVLPYISAQVMGAIAASALLYCIASGQAGFTTTTLAANGYGEHSPGLYHFNAGLITEVVMTFMFLIVILGATHKRASPGFAGLAIGLALTLIHLISIPITNTSVNPARSTGPALFGPAYALSELWIFWAAPIAGALLGAAIYRARLSDD